jgi:mono/diheme cytochrome c family protein
MTRTISRLRSIAPIAVLLAVGAPAVAQSPDGSFASPFRFMQRDGEAIYRSVCQGCHMPDGQGAVGAGAYPALAKNPRLEAAGYPVLLVVNGRKAMPPFGGLLDDDQVAAVVTYVRSHFDNAYQDAVSAADVSAARR